MSAGVRRWVHPVASIVASMARAYVSSRTARAVTARAVGGYVVEMTGLEPVTC